MNDIIISIYPEYVKKILSGEKTIELRRRLINIPPETKVWIYSTMPQGEVVATTILEKISVMTPSMAWNEYSEELNIDKLNYDSYTDSLDFVYLFHLSRIKKFKKSISLKELRSINPKFHPPQFFMKLKSKPEIECLLKSFEQ